MCLTNILKNFQPNIAPGFYTEDPGTGIPGQSYLPLFPYPLGVPGLSLYMGLSQSSGPLTYPLGVPGLSLWAPSMGAPGLSQLSAPLTHPTYWVYLA